MPPSPTTVNPAANAEVSLKPTPKTRKCPHLPPECPTPQTLHARQSRRPGHRSSDAESLSGDQGSFSLLIIVLWVLQGLRTFKLTNFKHRTRGIIIAGSYSGIIWGSMGFVGLTGLYRVYRGDNIRAITIIMELFTSSCNGYRGP